MRSCPPAQVPALESSGLALGPGMGWERDQQGTPGSTSGVPGTGTTSQLRAHRAFSSPRTAQHRPGALPVLPDTQNLHRGVRQGHPCPGCCGRGTRSPALHPWDGRGAAGPCEQEPSVLPWERETRENKEIKLSIPGKHL